MPEELVSLIEQGTIDSVVRPLMSGKEAQVYLVVAHGEQHVAKIYKEANNRSFRHRSQYTEGRRVRNSRDQRAMSKRSRFGRAQDEAAWRAAEVDVIYRLRQANVCVPEPKAYVDGVLVMELITDRLGEPAPRLADLTLQRNQGEELFEKLLREVVKMLCAGLVHGDLSEFNILVGTGGAVIIDFPQAVDSATNQNARKLLLRDIGNLTRYFSRFRHSLRSSRYGEEIWDLYERGELKPDTALTGKFQRKNSTQADVSSLLAEMQEIDRENRARREALGLPPARPARQPRPVVEPTVKKDEGARDQAPANPSRRGRRPRRRPASPSPGSDGGREKSQTTRGGPAKPGKTDQRPNRSESSAPASKPRRRHRSRRRPSGNPPR